MDISDWDVTPSDFSTIDHRVFRVKPKERMILDFNTFERYRGRVITAVVPCEVIDGEIRHYWKTREQKWDSQITLNIFQLNPQTMQRFSPRNPKSERINVASYAYEERDEAIVGEAEIRRILYEATIPKSRILQVEEPV